MDRYLKESDVNAVLKKICEDTATTYGVEHGGRAEKFARLTENIPGIRAGILFQTDDEIMNLIRENAQNSITFNRILHIINVKDRQIEILKTKLAEDIKPDVIKAVREFSQKLKKTPSFQFSLYQQRIDEFTEKHMKKYAKIDKKE